MSFLGKTSQPNERLPDMQGKIMYEELEPYKFVEKAAAKSSTSGSGTMTNKEHATQLREIIVRYDSEPQESEIPMGVLEPLTKEAADTLLKALSSNHRFTESSDPSE